MTRHAVLVNPALCRVEMGLGFLDMPADQVGLVGTDMADGDIGLAPPQVAERVGGDNLQRDLRRGLPDAMHNVGQLQIRRRRRW